jgi:hypothetical protein
MKIFGYGGSYGAVIPQMSGMATVTIINTVFKLTIITNLDKIKMATKPANAAQKQWMSDIVDWAICNIGMLYGDEYYNAIPQLHHVTGRSSKHNKVAIGNYFILPIPFILHDVSSNHPENVTHCKKAFVKRFGTQRSLFKRMYQSMKEQGYKVPNSHVFSAIMGTSA